MKHLLNFNDYDGNLLYNVITRGLEIKKNPEKYAQTLKGKKLYMLFQKTSTRTALSFSMGVTELGGTYFLQNWADSNFTIGELEDEIKYVSKSVDIVMARLKENQTINLMAQHANVPVINGCCNKYHPCQALADMLTIKEVFGHFNIKMLYLGVKNNVFNSLLEILPKLGGELYSITPLENQASFDEQLYREALQTGLYHDLAPSISASELKEIAQGVDIIYTDSWVDMEFFNNPEFSQEKEERIQKLLPFQVNEKLLEGSKALVMHDMPMHPGYEISKGIAAKNMELILQQADNRKYAQNGIITMLLESR